MQLAWANGLSSVGTRKGKIVTMLSLSFLQLQKTFIVDGNW